MVSAVQLEAVGLGEIERELVMLHLQLVAYTLAPLGFKDGAADLYANGKCQKFSAKITRVEVKRK